jgi:hypothetical protein
MDGQEVVFHGAKVPQKTDRGLIKVKAYNGLAQILAASVETEEIILISGWSTSAGSGSGLRRIGDEGRELQLNEPIPFNDENPEEEEGGGAIDIIRICFDVRPIVEIHRLQFRRFSCLFYKVQYMNDNI